LVYTKQTNTQKQKQKTKNKKGPKNELAAATSAAAIIMHIT